MTEQRLQYIRSLDNLTCLVPHTDLLTLNERGNVVVPEKLPAPIDQFGIPRPEITVNMLLDHMQTENYIWTGKYDLHHVATPKADYSVVRRKDEGDIGSAFRGVSALKIELPRQMHNFSHAVFELPRRPSIDILRQFLIEIGQAKQLHTLAKEYIELEADSDLRVQKLCKDGIEKQLESMKDSQLGTLPHVEVLAKMEIGSIYTATAALLRVRRFSRKHLVHKAIRKASDGLKVAA